jgi:hypothetical protein
MSESDPAGHTVDADASGYLTSLGGAGGWRTLGLDCWAVVRIKWGSPPLTGRGERRMISLNLLRFRSPLEHPVRGRACVA